MERYKKLFKEAKQPTEFKTKFNSGDIVTVPMDAHSSRGKNTLVDVKVLEFADKQEMNINYFVEHPKGFLNLLVIDTEDKYMITHPDIGIEEIIEPRKLQEIADKYKLEIN